MTRCVLPLQGPLLLKWTSRFAANVFQPDRRVSLHIILFHRTDQEERVRLLSALCKPPYTRIGMTT